MNNINISDLLNYMTPCTLETPLENVEAIIQKVAYRSTNKDPKWINFCNQTFLHNSISTEQFREVLSKYYHAKSRAGAPYNITIDFKILPEMVYVMQAKPKWCKMINSYTVEQLLSLQDVYINLIHPDSKFYVKLLNMIIKSKTPLELEKFCKYLNVIAGYNEEQYAPICHQRLHSTFFRVIPRHDNVAIKYIVIEKFQHKNPIEINQYQGYTSTYETKFKRTLKNWGINLITKKDEVVFNFLCCLPKILQTPDIEGKFKINLGTTAVFYNHVDYGLTHSEIKKLIIDNNVDELAKIIMYHYKPITEQIIYKIKKWINVFSNVVEVPDHYKNIKIDESKKEDFDFNELKWSFRSYGMSYKDFYESVIIFRGFSPKYQSPIPNLLKINNVTIEYPKVKSFVEPIIKPVNKYPEINRQDHVNTETLLKRLKKLKGIEAYNYLLINGDTGFNRCKFILYQIMKFSFLEESKLEAKFFKRCSTRQRQFRALLSLLMKRFNMGQIFFGKMFGGLSKVADAIFQKSQTLICYKPQKNKTQLGNIIIDNEINCSELATTDIVNDEIPLLTSNIKPVKIKPKLIKCKLIKERYNNNARLNTLSGHLKNELDYFWETSPFLIFGDDVAYFIRQDNYDWAFNTSAKVYRLKKNPEFETFLHIHAPIIYEKYEAIAPLTKTELEAMCPKFKIKYMVASDIDNVARKIVTEHKVEVDYCPKFVNDSRVQQIFDDEIIENEYDVESADENFDNDANYNYDYSLIPQTRLEKRINYKIEKMNKKINEFNNFIIMHKDSPVYEPSLIDSVINSLGVKLPITFLLPKNYGYSQLYYSCTLTMVKHFNNTSFKSLKYLRRYSLDKKGLKLNY